MDVETRDETSWKYLRMNVGTVNVGHIIATLGFIDNINQKYSLYIMEGNLEKRKKTI